MRASVSIGCLISTQKKRLPTPMMTAISSLGAVVGCDWHSKFPHSSLQLLYFGIIGSFIICLSAVLLNMFSCL